MSAPVVTAAPSAGTAVAAARTRVVQGALTLGVVAVAGVLLVRPGPDRADRSYSAVAAGRDAAWLGHLVECVGYGLAGVGLALAVCLLVRHRGAVWATVGACAVATGGLLYAAMAYALGVFDWYATASTALPAADGAALLAFAQDDSGRLVAADVAGFLLFTLGSLLVCVALWRSQAVHRAVPVAVVLLTVAQFAVPPGRALDVVQALLLAAFLPVAAAAGRPRG